ncbi:MAG: HEAT repeat domain-containing protein [Candidatus Firestonebacteria bacterium]|nr:HEAT repeat domain-containing protein [Candidatus Firestonebacteria bacterium]
MLTGALSAWGAQPEHEKFKHDLETGQEYKRIMTLESLTRFSDPKVYGWMLHSLIYDPSHPVRRAAQRALAHVQDPQIFPALTAALQSPEKRVRLAGLEAFGLVRDPVGAAFILQDLQAHARDYEEVLVGLEALREFVYRTEPRPGFEAGLAPFLTYRPSWWLFTRHDQKKMAETAVAVLAIMARPESLSLLVPLWDRADAALKILLADAFANIGRQTPVPVLLRGLGERHADVVIHCLYALGHIQAFSSLDAIQALLKTETNPRVLMAGVNALIEIPDDENATVLLSLLSNEDASVRHWAVYALGQMQAQQAVPALIGKLNDASSLVRATAVMALAELKAASAQPQLLKLLSNRKEAEEVRLAAAKALMALGDKTGADVFWQELQRSDLTMDMRLQYALALGSCRLEAYRAPLVEDLLQTTDFTRTLVAALALGIMNDSQAVPVLLQTLDHGSAAVRRYAILGLEGFKRTEVLSALATLANEDYDPVVRILCAARLAASGYTEYRVLLWNALENQSEDIRSEALIALGRSADAQVLKQLKWYLRREPSVPVRETIWRILRAHENR